MTALPIVCAKTPDSWFWVSSDCQEHFSILDEPGRLFVVNFSFTRLRPVDLQHGLRLIIVDKANLDKDLMADEWIGEDPDPRGKSKPPPDQYPPPRVLRSALSAKRRCAVDYSLKTPFTLVLECTSEGGVGEWAPTLYLLPTPVSELTRDVTDRSLPKVIYDRIYPPRIKTAGLTTSIVIRTEDCEESHWYRHRMDNIYLNISRETASERSPAQALPKTALVKLADYAIMHYDAFSREWNDTIFSIGMVCRTWSEVFILRWFALGNERWVRDIKCFRHYKPAIEALKRGLTTVEAGCFEGFDISRFSQSDPRLSEFGAAIIKRVKNLRYLIINPEIFTLARESIAQQTIVSNLSILCEESFGRLRGEPVHCNMSTVDVERVVQPWTGLRVLVIQLSRDDIPFLREKHAKSKAESEAPTCGKTDSNLLEKLGLYNGFFSRNDLISILPKSVDRLHTVILWRMTGLTTNDISTLLSLTHSTLACLRMSEAYITKDTVVHPLDIWIPKMKHLVRASVPASVGSLLSISLKPPSENYPSQWDPPLHVGPDTESHAADSLIEILFWDGSDIIPTSGSRQADYESDPSRFLASIFNQTNWNNVYISRFGARSMTTAQLQAWKDARASAGEKGIKVTLVGID